MYERSGSPFTILATMLSFSISSLVLPSPLDGADLLISVVGTLATSLDGVNFEFAAAFDGGICIEDINMGAATDTRVGFVLREVILGIGAVFVGGAGESKNEKSAVAHGSDIGERGIVGI